jgi:hypothetical protein
MTESNSAVMAGLVPAIHVVQLKKRKRFASVLTRFWRSRNNILKYW